MKRNYLYLALSVLISSFFICSCSEKDAYFSSKNDQPHFRVIPDNYDYTFESEGGTVEYSIESSEEWNYTTNTNASFRYTKYENNLTIESTPYYILDSKEERSDTISIIASGFEAITIKVHQTPEYLITNLSECLILDTGDTISLTIDTNKEWNISTNSNWISLDKTHGSNEAEIEVIISPNLSSETTIDTIIVSTEHLSKRIIITREGYKYRYSLGEIYPDTLNPKGVVVAVSNGGKNGKVLALTNHSTYWSSENYIINTTSDNGKINTDKALERYRTGPATSTYPIFSVCRGNGTEWYLPAIYEISQAIDVIKALSEKEKEWKQHGWESLPSILMSSSERSASECLVWYTKENTMNYIKKNVTTTARAMCQF